MGNSSASALNSMSNGSSSGGIRENWLGVIVFVDQDLDKLVLRSDDNDELSDYVDTSQNLIRVELYRCTKGKRKLSTTLNHVYIIFETPFSFFLVEKTTASLVLHKSWDKTILKGRDINKTLNQTWEMVYEDEVKLGMTVENLMRFLEDEKGKKYRLLFDNCQHFGQRCFNHFAQKIKCNMY